ncbi:glycosyltransferase [Xenorhabdus sp. KJ12.1]|uniref:glycosyltransferase n=1 Tax=Xenorhabdus sp. KJ12.1 TaxID=1851571 RepID=UPI000C055626|nr:glycosyltransferase [Xenorhabdus sp. KJ12.1]PHM68335.1 N-acetylglucosaminyl-phosphatidylinositol biosynthesis protein [Xenorhabdus sp. KJ12.1]
MKVLLVNTSFFPCIGGVENSLRSICNILVIDGHSVDIIASDCNQFKRTEKSFNSNITRYRQHKYGFFFISLLKTLLKKDLNSYDIIISRHTITTFALLLLGVKKTLFIVPGVHFYQNKKDNETILGKIKFKLNLLLEKYVFIKTDNLFVFSETMKNQVSIYRKRKEVLTLNPGVDNTRFHKIANPEKINLRKNLQLPINKKIIFSLGRLVDVKNFETLIKAVSLMPNNYYLVIVGDGPEKENLYKLIHELNIRDKVSLISSTQSPEKYYSIADIFCLPSTYEPFGQVLLEATFSELPIVAIKSDAKGIDTATSSIYRDYHSLITYSDSNSPIGLSDALIKASSTIFSISELEKFKSVYSWNSMVKELINHNKIQH